MVNIYRKKRLEPIVYSKVVKSITEDYELPKEVIDDSRLVKIRWLVVYNHCIVLITQVITISVILVEDFSVF